MQTLVDIKIPREIQVWGTETPVEVGAHARREYSSRPK